MMRILILAGGGIGDVLMTTPMFRAIKEKYPDSFLAVGVDGKTNIELLSTNKRIDLLFNYGEFKGIVGFLKFINFFKKNDFNYCFHNHCVSGRKYIIIPFLAGIKNRIGFNKRLISKKYGHNLLSNIFFTKSILYIPGKEKRVKKNISLLKKIDIENKNFDYELFLTKKINRDANLIGIHPGSDKNGAIKRWNIYKYIELSKLIEKDQNYRVKFFIGPDESDIASCIHNIKLTQFDEKSSIYDTIYKITECSYFISNDSGLSHIAAALKIPSIVIYGPTSKNEYVLPVKNKSVEINNLPCRPCWYKNRAEYCNGNIYCLANIQVADVYQSFTDLILK